MLSRFATNLLLLYDTSSSLFASWVQSNLLLCRLNLSGTYLRSLFIRILKLLRRRPLKILLFRLYWKLTYVVIIFKKSSIFTLTKCRCFDCTLFSFGFFHLITILNFFNFWNYLHAFGVFYLKGVFIVNIEAEKICRTFSWCQRMVELIFRVHWDQDFLWGLFSIVRYDKVLLSRLHLFAQKVRFIQCTIRTSWLNS